ncbi:MAG: trypsin-like peptidase domain-containing protein [Bacteroidetes bacterium]|nr:trypsin-like peptidase domain-containing protein [Bacteroidota bacterium]MBL6963953.1 trypsin-like peptidase domain-containing protein [Bacteroidota bacterium]
MEKDIHNQDLIDRFLRDELKQDELQEFNQRMKEDEAFAREVEEQLELIQSLKHAVRVGKLKQKMNKAHHELEHNYPFIPSRKKRSIRSFLYTTAVAASIALAIVLGTLYFAGWFDYNRNIASYYELKKDIENLSTNQKSMWKALFKAEKKTVVKYSGTCFLLTSDGYFVTNYHLVKNNDTILVTNNTDSLIQFKAIVAYANRSADLAILKAIYDSGYHFGSVPFMISPLDVNLGQDVFTLGFSKADVVFGEGTINSLSGFKSDTIAYETSVPANPGNSGAPLLDNKGNLIGIISGKHAKKVSSTFAIKAKYLQCIVDEMASDSTLNAIILPKVNSIKWLSRTDQIKKLQPFIYKVEVYQ